MLLCSSDIGSAFCHGWAEPAKQLQTVLMVVLSLEHPKALKAVFENTSCFQMVVLSLVRHVSFQPANPQQHMFIYVPKFYTEVMHAASTGDGWPQVLQLLHKMRQDIERWDNRSVLE